MLTKLVKPTCCEEEKKRASSYSMRISRTPLFCSEKSSRWFKFFGITSLWLITIKLTHAQLINTY